MTDFCVSNSASLLGKTANLLIRINNFAQNVAKLERQNFELTHRVGESPT